MENGYSLSDIAATNGGGFGGSSSWVLIILFALIFGFGGNGLGGNNANDAIQRAVDLNSIQEGQAAINANVQRVANENMSSIKDAQMANLTEIRDNGMMIANLQSAMQSCCCENKQLIMENRYLAEKATADSTAKILEALTTNRMADMQNQINQLQLQNAMNGVVRYPQMTTYAVPSPCFNGCQC